MATGLQRFFGCRTQGRNKIDSLTPSVRYTGSDHCRESAMRPISCSYRSVSEEQIDRNDRYWPQGDSRRV